MKKTIMCAYCFVVLIKGVSQEIKNQAGQLLRCGKRLMKYLKSHALG